jgi:hypothetical protein
MKMSMEVKNIIPLLTNVALIKNKYDEIAKITGENFNVFKILGLTTNEVRTHSAFLSELLNPKGNHGQGDLFLKLFLTQFELEFETKNAIVEIEKHTGFINEEYTEGGYIDIIISNGKKAIIIENKIYAGDQSNQLVRYSNYTKKIYGLNNFHLLYLTLNGKDASHESKGQLVLNSDYHLISYENDILDWLELCKKESVSLPILRETILQYINLIKYLTNQSTNNKMSTEIIDEILITNKIEEALVIGDNINELKFKIMAHFSQLLIKMANENNFLFNFNDVRFGENESEMIFKKVGYKYSVCLAVYNNFKIVNIGIIDQNGAWYKEMISNFSEWSNTSLSDVYKGVLVGAVKDKLESYFQKIENIKE